MLARRRTHWVWPASLQHSKLDIWGVEIFKVNSCTVQIAEGWHSTSTCVGNKQWTQKFALKKNVPKPKKCSAKKLAKSSSTLPTWMKPIRVSEVFWSNFPNPTAIGDRNYTLAKRHFNGEHSKLNGVIMLEESPYHPRWLVATQPESFHHHLD